MRTRLKTLITAFALVAGIAAAPVLYAQSAEDTPGTRVAPMGPGNTMGHDKAMGQGNTMAHGNMMDQGNTMGMMNMTDQMGQMMETHGQMMQTMMDAHCAAQSDKK